MLEDIRRDSAVPAPHWCIANLRYFNPVGAHESGLVGEDPNGIANCLLPNSAQVAVEKQPNLTEFGCDYPTHDGTGVRDYIHGVDVADGHLRALKVLETRTGADVWSVGTVQGYSVLDMVRALEVANGK